MLINVLRFFSLRFSFIVLIGVLASIFEYLNISIFSQFVPFVLNGSEETISEVHLFSYVIYELDVTLVVAGLIYLSLTVTKFISTASISYTGVIVGKYLESLFINRLINTDIFDLRSKDQAHLHGALLHKINMFVMGMLQPILNISISLISILFIMVAVVDYKVDVFYWGAILVVIFGLIYGVASIKAQSLSLKISKSTDGASETLFDVISSMEDLKVNGLVNRVKDDYLLYDSKIRFSHLYLQLIQLAPKYIFDFLIAFALLFLGFSAYSSNLNESNNVIEIVIVGIMIGSRVIPAISQIYANLISIRGNLHVFRDLESLYLRIESKAESHNRKILSICLKDFSLHTGFDKLTINIYPGKIYSLRGVNGIGKSTLANWILGLTDYKNSKYSGFLVNYVDDGFDLHNGYCSQRPFVFNGSVLSNFSNESNTKLAMEILSSLDFSFEATSKNMSGGEKQKLAIARALSARGSIIVLDEPTSALDYKSVDNFINLFKQHSWSDKIIIIISHDNRLESIYDERILLKKN